MVVPEWRRVDGKDARLEVAFRFDGRARYADVALRHPTAAMHVAAAADSDGAAALSGERAKWRRYPNVPDAALPAVEPFVLETFGRFGRASLTLLREARLRVEERDPALRGWAGEALAQRWFAQLRVASLLGSFEASRAAWGVAGPLGSVGPTGSPAGPLPCATLGFDPGGD